MVAQTANAHVNAHVATSRTSWPEMRIMTRKGAMIARPPSSDISNRLSPRFDRDSRFVYASLSGVV